MKVCNKCGKEKESSKFSIRDKSKGTRRNDCKKCNKKYLSEYHQNRKKQKKILNSSGAKICAVCDEEKLYEEFSKFKSSKDGYQPNCKSCIRDYNRILKSKDKVINPSGLKICAVCKITKSYEEFGDLGRTADGYNSECKVCVNLRAERTRKINYENNKEGIDLDGNKYCSGCKEEKLKSEFAFNIYGTKGLRNTCKDCNNIRSRKIYKENDGGAYYRLLRYGLNKEDYKGLLLKQNNSCEICGAGDKELVVDHCHICGYNNLKAVRGLLCQGCNGHFNFSLDNPEILQKATNYSLKHWNNYHRD